MEKNPVKNKPDESFEEEGIEDFEIFQHLEGRRGQVEVVRMKENDVSKDSFLRSDDKQKKNPIKTLLLHSFT